MAATAGQGAGHQPRRPDHPLGSVTLPCAIPRRRDRQRAADAAPETCRGGPAMTSVAEWSAARKQYGTITAVRDVSLALELGEVIALVGHNGAGKTTLIKLLLGLIRPTAGTVRLLGADPASRGGADARLGIGFLPESIAFHGSMTGLELMDFYSRLKGQPRRANRDLLARVGLTEAANRRVGTYSKGMRQRLGIAQALIGDPKLLIFDEPTSGLDPASRSAVYAMIGELRAAGTTVLICTHALSE